MRLVRLHPRAEGLSLQRDAVIECVPPERYRRAVLDKVHELFRGIESAVTYSGFKYLDAPRRVVEGRR